MWQRIQTLFMFLGAAAAFAMGYLALNAGNSVPAQLDLLIWPTGLVAGLLLANIFNFRKRKLQIRLNSWALLVLMLAFSAEIYYYFVLKGVLKASLVCGILAVWMIVLANRAIRRDEEKVRAADRLR